MNRSEHLRFQSLVREVAESPLSQVLRTFRQHGTISTYDHCMSVARISFRLARALRLKIDEHALVRGAFLHDYYLYDWHHTSVPLHGFRHPQLAVVNARRDFHITPLEAGIIRTHMWPLTLTEIPRSKEALLVSVADKICALRETLLQR